MVVPASEGCGAFENVSITWIHLHQLQFVNAVLASCAICCVLSFLPFVFKSAKAQKNFTQTKATQTHPHHHQKFSVLGTCGNVDVLCVVPLFLCLRFGIQSCLLFSFRSTSICLHDFCSFLFTLLLPSLPLLLSPSCDYLTLSRCKGALAPIPPAWARTVRLQ